MRHTTVHNRFQVGCSHCGFVDSYAKLADAKTHAVLYAGRHNGPQERITIFDCMAHVGQPEVRSPLGNVLSLRGDPNAQA